MAGAPRMRSTLTRLAFHPSPTSRKRCVPAGVSSIGRPRPQRSSEAREVGRRPTTSWKSGAAANWRSWPSDDVRPRRLSDRTRQEAACHRRARPERQSRKNRMPVRSRSCGPAIDPDQSVDSLESGRRTMVQRQIPHKQSKSSRNDPTSDEQTSPSPSRGTGQLDFVSGAVAPTLSDLIAKANILAPVVGLWAARSGPDPRGYRGSSRARRSASSNSSNRLVATTAPRRAASVEFLLLAE